MKKCSNLFKVILLGLTVVFLMTACGGGNNPSVFVGRWELINGNFPFDKAELFKDGTGVVDTGGFSWKVVDKRLVLTHPFLR